MAGLVLSIEAKVGASIREGDLVAIIEAMKMRRHVNSPEAVWSKKFALKKERWLLLKTF